MRKNYFFLVMLFCVFTNMATAQVGLGTMTPDASSILDLSSTSRGFLAPRMTTAERAAIVSPAEGLLVYDITTHSFWLFYAPQWTEIPLGGTLWNRIGTKTTLANPGDNVGIGTTPASTNKLDLSADGTAINRGINVNVTGGSENVGGYFKVDGTDATGVLGYNSGTSGTGVIGDGYYGVLGQSNNSAGGAAIWAHQLNPSGNSIYSTGGINYFEGYTGIGTNTPVANLDVDGSFIFTGGSGDINKNGSIDNVDALLAYQHGNGNLNLTREQRALGDVNGDGKNDITDGLILINIFLDKGTLEQYLKNSRSVTAIPKFGDLDVLGDETFQVNGYLNLSTVATPPDTTDDNLYNIGGSLYWHGANISESILPIGTAGQTLRHNGTSWIANSLLANNGSNIGIGTQSFGDDAVNVLGLGNATPPATSPANVLQVYSQRVDAGYFTARNTLLVRDDLGEIVALGPLTDRWVGSSSNTFFGIGVAGAGALSNRNGEYGLGINNTAFGINGLHNITWGSGNTAIGTNSLYSDTIGCWNTGVGALSLYNTTSGEHNTAIGYLSLYSNTTGIENTAVGNSALGIVSTGSYNTAIGASAGVLAGSTYYSTAIGYGAVATASNQVRLGNGSVTSLYCSGPNGTTTTNAPNLFINSSDGQIMRSTATLLSGSGTAGRVTFWTGASGLSADGNFFWDNTNKRLGLGTTTPDALLEIRTSSTSDRQAVKIDQQSSNQSFIDYNGTFDNIHPPTTTDFNGNLTTYNNSTGTVVGPKNGAGMGWSYVGMMKVEINGATYWMPYYAPEGPECPRVDAWIDGQWIMVGRAIQHLNGREKDGRHDITLKKPAQRFRLVEDEMETSYVHRIIGDGEDWGLGEIVTTPAPQYGVDGFILEFQFSKPVTHLETYGYYEFF